MHANDLVQVEDIKYILKELEKEGVEGGEAAALVALWNRTQQQQQEIKEWRVYLTDLTLPQDNTSEGLKVWLLDHWHNINIFLSFHPA